MSHKLRNLAICLCCGTILESKHRHDYQVCPCPNRTMVDGGLDYTKGGGVDMSKAKWVSSMEEALKIQKENGPYTPITKPKPPVIKWYLGCTKNPDHSIKYHMLRTEVKPSEDLYIQYGHVYFALIGPFKTKRGAHYMQANPGCETVQAAEQLARCQPKKEV